MPWARASALYRHLNCPATSWLPQWDREAWRVPYLGVGVLPSVAGETRDHTSADWGTEMHAAKSGVGAIPLFQEYLPPPVVEKLWPSALGNHEQAYSYDCETGIVEVGPHGLTTKEMDDWKNSRAASCVVGTADWDAMLPSGEPWIDDLKTGAEQAVDTPAMLFYGACKREIHHSDSVRLSITHYPRPERKGDIPDPLTITRKWLRVTFLVLDEFKEEMHKAWRLTRRRGLDIVVPGDHCEWCPSVFVCPAYKFMRKD